MASISNPWAVSAARNLQRTQDALARSFDKLSSGYRIVNARDDAAGLAITESMKAQIRSYNQVEINANSAISMASTADGALGEVSDVLGRLRELAVEASNGSLQGTDRDYLQMEFKSLQAEVKGIMTGTKMDGTSLVRAASAAVTFQVGIDNAAADRVTVTFGAISLTAMVSSTTTLSGATNTNALAAISTIDTALATVSKARARFGAAMNRMDAVVNVASTVRMNLTAATSRLRDVDVAEETANLARLQVQAQLGVSVLSQSNQNAALILALVK